MIRPVFFFVALCVSCWLAPACGSGGDAPNVPELIPTGVMATLSWDPVSDPSVRGYRLYYGLLPHAYDSSVDAGPATTYTVANLQADTTYYFAVTAYNSAGESGYSNEVSATFP